MAVPGIGASAPVKVELDTGARANEDVGLAESKFVNRAVTQADGTDQRIESRLAVVRQQVSANPDTADSNSATLRKPKVSSELSFALTHLAVKNETSSDSSTEDSSSGDSSQSDSQDPESNRAQQDSVDKPRIQF